MPEQWDAIVIGAGQASSVHLDKSGRDRCLTLTNRPTSGGQFKPGAIQDLLCE